MKAILLFFKGLLLLTCFAITAQNETANWYTNSDVGLQFASSGTSTLGGLSLPTMPQPLLGTACISDVNGNLLLYTDGETLWNASNQIVANGTAICGPISYSSRPIIIKKPLSATEYYIFSENGNYNSAGQNGLRYSIIDVSLANGQGSVTVKNAMVDTLKHCTKIAATNHCNGRDVWILVHSFDTNQFMAYLLTPTGLSTSPVVSAIGQTGNHLSRSDMKFSPNGRKIGLTATYSFELFDFDKLTGIVSNYFSLGGSFVASGCEFSPDGSKFYGCSHLGVVANSSYLYQWDLCASANGAVLSYSVNLPLDFLDGMQMGKDGKIYAGGSHSIGNSTIGNGMRIIQSPNLIGAACNFTSNTSSLFWCNALALPAFNSSLFYNLPYPSQYTIQLNQHCQTIDFLPVLNSNSGGCIGSGNAPSFVNWNFGEPSSLSANTSTLIQASHHYSALGNYTITAILAQDCTTDTVLVPVIITSPDPVISIFGVTQFCQGETSILTAFGTSSYTWSTGINTSSISISPLSTVTLAVQGLEQTTGCLGESRFVVTVDVCDGIQSLYNYSTCKVHPNPAHSEIQIDLLDEYDQHLQIELIASDGRVHQFPECPTDLDKRRITLDLKGVKNGLYLLSLKKDKQLVYSTRVIIE